MGARWGIVLIAGFFGFAASLVFYLMLFVIQIQNADNACESPHAVLGIKIEDLRGIGFENSLLNLGGRCEYRMDDGSVLLTREPGWWFSGSIAGFVAAFAGAIVLFVRRKGHAGVLYGLTALLAPPMGLLLAIAAPRRASAQGPAAL